MVYPWGIKSEFVQLVLRMQEWPELCAALPRLPSKHTSRGTPGYDFPTASCKPGAHCMARSLMPQSKRAELSVWCGKGTDKTKADCLADVLSDVSRLSLSRKEELMNMLHTGLWYLGLKNS